MGSASMWDDVATLVKHGFAKQELASLSEEDAAGGVRVSRVSEYGMAPEQVAGLAILTGK